MHDDARNRPSLERLQRWTGWQWQAFKHSQALRVLRRVGVFLARLLCLRLVWNGLRFCLAFIVGERHTDERRAFSKARLVKNDYYRDRLLAEEIADLVDLWDALHFSLTQRKAFFRCFTNLDFLRRASLSRPELLRAWNLRATPLTDALLPISGTLTHRGKSQRWDVGQFLALSFSLCTMTPTQLMRVCIAAAKAHHATQLAHAAADAAVDQTDAEIASTDDIPRPSRLGTAQDLVEQISTCMHFFLGVLTPMDQALLSLLTEFYRPPEDRNTRWVDFRLLHDVRTLDDLAQYFPVVFFPCVWLQRVMQVRVIGKVTWQQLARRRRQLQSVGLNTAFLSPNDIITASKIHLQRKLMQQPSRKHSAHLRLLGDGEPPDDEDIDAGARGSTPRKVLPSVAMDDLAATQLSSGAPNVTDELFDSLKSIEQAWHVTADSLLASLFVMRQMQRSPDKKRSQRGLQALFMHTLESITTQQVDTELCDEIRRLLSHKYGYHFAKFVSENSSVAHIMAVSLHGRSALEEQRAVQRYDKAWRYQISMDDDKASYWKEFTDPVAQRVFYYNIRTGESRWIKPRNFVRRRTKRTGKKAKTKVERE